VVAELVRRGFASRSAGLFDSLVSFCRTISLLISTRDSLILSSNLKANIIALFLTRAPHIMVLNGMGIVRKSKVFRKILGQLVMRSTRLHLVAQSYADFRYFRRFYPQVPMTWIPGSGGTAKLLGPSDVPIIVQRDKKLPLVARDVAGLFSSLLTTSTLVVVGCTDHQSVSKLLPIEHQSVGFVPSSEIFRYGGTFIQPEGYGEGFPHSLADAIASRMTILIANRESIRYGLARMGAALHPVAPGWSLLQLSARLIELTSSKEIALKTADLCERLIDRTSQPNKAVTEQPV
jgi:hypothetical protein